MTFWSKVVVPALNWIGLLGSLAGLAVAAGLLLDSRATFGLFGRLNRWISTRQAMKPLEVPRRMERDMRGSLRWYAIAWVIGGGYSAFALLTQLKSAATVSALGFGNSIPALIVVETLRWILIVGGTAAALLGLLALLSPARWHALEVRANQWYSTRQAVATADAMDTTIDGWVERHPLPGAIVIGLASLAATAAYAFLLLG